MKIQRDRLRAQLDDLESDIQGLKSDHENELEDLKDDHDRDLDGLNEKWENKVGTEVERQLTKTIRKIRADAVARARACQLGKTLEKIAPMFPGFGHHPCDVRPIFDPIDFVIFDGYFEGDVTDITFVEFKTGESRPTQVQNSIRSAVEKKRVHFEVKRLNKEMIRMITTGQPLKLKRLVD